MGGHRDFNADGRDPLNPARHSPQDGEALPRSFVLHRDEDVTGISGIGIVAWGVEFPDGVVALRWVSEWPTSVVFHERGMDGVRAVHGHGGKTQVLWTDQIRVLRGEIEVAGE